MADFNELIPELARWNDGRGIDVESWINGIGNFEHAIAYSSLFWPEFVERDGCIFRAQIWDEKNYHAFLHSTHGDKTATEKVMNHLHLGDLYPNAAEATPAQRTYLSTLLKDIWQCKLRRDFPGLDVRVDLYECEQSDKEWQDCQITVYRSRIAT